MALRVSPLTQLLADAVAQPGDRGALLALLRAVDTVFSSPAFLVHAMSVSDARLDRVLSDQALKDQQQAQQAQQAQQQQQAQQTQQAQQQQQEAAAPPLGESPLPVQESSEQTTREDAPSKSEPSATQFSPAMPIMWSRWRVMVSKGMSVPQCPSSRKNPVA